MAGRTVTLNLPGELYDQLKRHAEQTQRPLEDELLDAVASAVERSSGLPDDLASALSQLVVLDDAALWRAARSRLAPKAAARLEALHLKRRRDGLTRSEAAEAAELVRQYERAMLVRARAAALLAERGHNEQR